MCFLECLHMVYLCILYIYIDDILITFKNMCWINNFKDQLSSDFKIKDLDATKKILGIKLHRGGSFGKLYTCHKKNILRRYLSI